MIRKTVEDFDKRFRVEFDDFVFVMADVEWVDDKIVAFNDGRVYGIDNPNHIIGTCSVGKYGNEYTKNNLFTRFPYNQFEYFSNSVLNAIAVVEERVRTGEFPIDESQEIQQIDNAMFDDVDPIDENVPETVVEE